MHDNPRLLAAAALVLVAGLGYGCAGEPAVELELADWILPVPEGVPVREYAPVSRELRDPNAIVLEEDLVLGGTPDATFYSAPRIAVADDGRIYVLDPADDSVRAYSPQGELLRKFGREGQGPGEMEQGRGITIAGDHVLIADGLSRTRILAFTLDGDPVQSYQTPGNFGLRFHGLPDGTFIESTYLTVEDRSRRRIAARYNQQGEELYRYLDLDGAPPRNLPDTRDRSVRMAAAIQDRIRSARVPLVMVHTHGERAYATLGEQYEVLALNLEGEPLWALRVAWSRPPYPERSKEFDRSQAEVYGFDPDTLEYPELDVAVNASRLDGHGRLYVYPNPGEQPEENPDRPIDVYSPEGDLIAAGFGPATWRVARGDYVYFLRHDEETDDWYVIRSKLTVNAR
jgi:tripartite motif-containing protein 2/3/tripartite motif-containing protein 71